MTRPVAWRLPKSCRAACIRRFAAALLATLLIQAPGWSEAADPVVTVSDGIQAIDLTRHVQLLEDPQQRFTFDEVSGAALGAQFQAATIASRSLGFTGSAWWVRFGVRNAGATELRLVVRQDYPLIDYLDMWSHDAAGAVVHVATGDRLPFDQRPLEHNEFLLPLVLGPGAEQTVHLRFATEGSLNIGLRLYTQESMLAAIGAEQLVWGAFYGSILLLAFANLLLFVLVRDSAFAYYFIYLLTYACYMAAYNGLTFQYLWPGSPELVSLSQLVLLALSLIFLLQFSRAILTLNELSPRLDRGARVLQLLTLLCIPAAPLVSYRMLILPLAALTLAITAYLLVAAIVGALAGRIAARVYLSGLSIFLIGVLVYMFKTFGLLPHNAITQHGYQLGALGEFMLLSIALGIRVGELKRTGLTDTLTGLYNRRHFDERIAAEFGAAQTRSRALALLVLDIDHFKRMNDTHGHAEGDRALQAVARVLRQQVRKPVESFRYGGEEFVVMLPGVRIGTALALAERLREQVAQETASAIPLTVSIGVASLDDPSVASAEDLFSRADAALYAAKKGGRNRVVDHPSWAAAQAAAAAAAEADRSTTGDRRKAEAG